MPVLGDPTEARGLSNTLIRRCPEEPLDELPVDETVIDSKNMELFSSCHDHFLLSRIDKKRRRRIIGGGEGEGWVVNFEMVSHWREKGQDI